MRSKKGKKRYFVSVAVIVLAYAAYAIFSTRAPRITGYESFAKMPRSEKITLTVRNDRPIDRFRVDIVQGIRHVTLIDDRDVGKEKTYSLDLEPCKLHITDGEATVILKADSGLFAKTSVTVPATVDTVPPAIEQVRSTPFVRQGSAGAIKVRAVGADRVFVKVGHETFPLSRNPEDGKNVYTSLFPVGDNVSPGTGISVVAEDDNENVRRAAVHTTITRSEFQREKIKISDGFLEHKIYPLAGEKESVMSPAGAIRRVNEEWRKEDGSFFRGLSRETADEPLWHGRFLQLKDSAVLATYGERRTLYYRGGLVSRSIHLGYDLASVRHAPVAAANSGKVVYTGKREIYGNTVIIDHGLGLMTLYGHLSRILVTEGQTVSKGDIIGRTGSTGLAMGDHLHFAVLVHGVFVNPLDWWDASWIKHRILYVLS